MKVSGLVTPRRLSEDAIAALESGDIAELIRINHAEFGSSVMMAEEDDADDDDDDDDDSDDTGADDTDKSKSKKSDDDGDDDDEKEKLRKRMRAADKRADAAEKALKKKEQAEKSDLERAQSELEEVTKERDALKTDLNNLRLQNAFLSANTHAWHDPDAALALADKNGYLEDVVDEDGVVDKKALKKALDRLATEKKFLVKDESKKDEPGEPSGEPAGGRSDNGKDDKAKAEQLRRRFPVLNR